MRRLCFLFPLLFLAACTLHEKDWSTEPLQDLLLHQQQNFAGIEHIEVSWRATFESARIGRVPFRLDVDWNPEKMKLELATPLGGRLLSLEGDPASTTLSSGRSLPRLLRRGLGALDESGWQGELRTGLEGLLKTEGERLGAFRITYASEEAALVLPLLDDSITGLLEDCTRATVAPWLWGELLPGSGALPSDAGEGTLSLCHADTCWTLDSRSGLWNGMRLPGIELELRQFSRQEGITLPKVIRLTRREKQQRLILERRRLHLNRPIANEAEPETDE